MKVSVSIEKPTTNEQKNGTTPNLFLKAKHLREVVQGFNRRQNIMLGLTSHLTLLIR